MTVIHLLAQYSKALDILINWVAECGFGYDNIPDEYEKYKSEIEERNLNYHDGIKYIVMKEAEKKKGCLNACSSNYL